VRQLTFLSPFQISAATNAPGATPRLVGNKAERQSRDSLIRPQQPTRVTESTELQREAELVRVAAGGVPR
jgi:hypothetical protein